MSSIKKPGEPSNKRSRDEHEDNNPSPSKKRLPTLPSAEENNDPSCAPDDVRVNTSNENDAQLPLTSSRPEVTIAETSKPPSVTDDNNVAATEPTISEKGCSPPEAVDAGTPAAPDADNVPSTEADGNPPAEKEPTDESSRPDATPPPRRSDRRSAPKVPFDAANPQPPPNNNRPKRDPRLHNKPYTPGAHGRALNTINCHHTPETNTTTLQPWAQAVLRRALVPVCFMCRSTEKRAFPHGTDECRCVDDVSAPLYCGPCRSLFFDKIVERAGMLKQWLTAANHREFYSGENVVDREMKFDYDGVRLEEIQGELRARGIADELAGESKEQLVARLRELDERAEQLCPCGRAASVGNDEVLYCTGCDGYVVRPDARRFAVVMAALGILDGFDDEPEEGSEFYAVYNRARENGTLHSHREYLDDPRAREEVPETEPARKNPTDPQPGPSNGAGGSTGHGNESNGQDERPTPATGKKVKRVRFLSPPTETSPSTTDPSAPRPGPPTNVTNPTDDDTVTTPLTTDPSGSQPGPSTNPTNTNGNDPKTGREEEEKGEEPAAPKPKKGRTPKPLPPPREPSARVKAKSRKVKENEGEDV